MGDRANHWWMVWCVLLLYSDLSAHVMSARMYRHLGGTHGQTSVTRWRTTNELRQDSAYTSGNGRTGDGVCNALVLRGISVIQGISKRRRFDTFFRSTSDKRHDILFRASHDPNVFLFYEKVLQKWVIGKIHKDNVSIAIQFECNTHQPEDSGCGAHISVSKGSSVTWRYDPSLHVECTNGLSTGRFKRFFFAWLHEVKSTRERSYSPRVKSPVEIRHIFMSPHNLRNFTIRLIFTFVTLTVVAVIGSIQEIQQKKGCLFYPSVCEMRDQINDELVPDIRNIKSTLEAFGNLQQLKKALQRTVYFMDEIKMELLDVGYSSKIYNQLRMISGLRNSLRNSSFSKDIHFLQEEVLNQYKEWVQGTPSAFDELIGSALTTYEIFSHQKLYLYSVTGKMTGTIVTAAIALVSGIVTIAFSIKKEHDIKEHLQENVAKLSETKVALVLQKREIQHFKKIYFSIMLPGLKNFAKELFPKFWRFLDQLRSSKINVLTIKNVNRELKIVIDQIKSEDMNLRDRIESLR